MQRASVEAELTRPGARQACCPARVGVYEALLSFLNALFSGFLPSLGRTFGSPTALAALPLAFLLWREAEAFPAGAVPARWLLGWSVLTVAACAAMTSGPVRALPVLPLTTAERARLIDARRARLVRSIAAAKSRARSAQNAGRTVVTVMDSRSSGTGMPAESPRAARPQPYRGSIAHDPCRSRAPGLIAKRLAALRCPDARAQGLRSHPRPCTKLTPRANKGHCLQETWQGS